MVFTIQKTFFLSFEIRITRPKAVIGPGGPSYASKAGAINARKSRVAEHLLSLAASPKLSTSSWWLGAKLVAIGTSS
jgi:hypothetical protein